MNPNTNYLEDKLLQTLAEAGDRLEQVKQEHPTIFVRPDDRTNPSHGVYWRANKASKSYIGFIKVYGNHTSQTPPVFHSEECTVTVVNRRAKQLSDVSGTELSYMYSDIDSPAALLAYLKEKYPHSKLTLDSIVTLYEVRYG